jgi:hypothetical protein
MIRHIAIIAVAAAGIYSAAPVSAEEIGVGIGPNGVTVGTVRGDRYRDPDRDYYRDRYRRDRNETVIIRRDRDRDRDYDRDRRPVVIDRY